MRINYKYKIFSLYSRKLNILIASFTLISKYKNLWHTLNKLLLTTKSFTINYIENKKTKLNQRLQR